MRCIRSTVILILALLSRISTADEQSIITKEELKYLFEDLDKIIPPTSLQVVDSSCIYIKNDQNLDEVKRCAEQIMQAYWTIFENYLVFQDPDRKMSLLDSFWTYISNMTKRTSLAQNDGIPLEDAYNLMLEQYFSVDL